MRSPARKPTVWTLRKANPDGPFSPPEDFLFQESLLYTSISLRRNVSARNSLRGLRTLIWINTLRRGHNVGFLAGRLSFTNFETEKELKNIQSILHHLCYCFYFFIYLQNVRLVHMVRDVVLRVLINVPTPTTVIRLLGSVCVSGKWEITIINKVD